jgi:4-hydroxy-tetrahydrodipicolinate synthase
MSSKLRHSEIKNILTGPIFTVFTSFTESGDINFSEIESYLKFLYEKNVRNFYVMPYNSRYSQLTEGEIYKLNEFVIRTVKEINKENFVIVSDCIHGPTTLSEKYGYKAFESGADMFASIVREKYFSNEQILSHFDYLSRNLSMPLLVHEMPFLSGYDAKNLKWPLSLIKELRTIENIVAIKEDAKDLEYGKKVIEILEPEIRIIFAGKKRYIKDLYPHGLKSYLNGTSIINPEIAFTFWDALNNKENLVVEHILNQIEDPFWNNVVSKYGWHRSNKALLHAAGLMSRYDRLPMEHLSNTEFESIKIFFENYKSKFLSPKEL